jgi:hypothetical protein
MYACYWIYNGKAGFAAYRYRDAKVTTNPIVRGFWRVPSAPGDWSTED